MNILNKAFYVIVTLVITLLLLAAVGWLLSFTVGNFTLNKPNDSDFDYFIARMIIGVMLMGFINGIHKLFDLCANVVKKTGG